MDLPVVTGSSVRQGVTRRRPRLRLRLRLRPAPAGRQETDGVVTAPFLWRGAGSRAGTTGEVRTGRSLSQHWSAVTPHPAGPAPTAGPPRRLQSDTTH